MSCIFTCDICHESERGILKYALLKDTIEVGNVDLFQVFEVPDEWLTMDREEEGSYNGNQYAVVCSDKCALVYTKKHDLDVKIPDKDTRGIPATASITGVKIGRMSSGIPDIDSTEGLEN